MKNKVRLLCSLLMFIIFCTIFTGCYDRREVDDLTFVIAVGLDKGKTNTLRLTLQYAIPKAMGGGEGGGGGGEKALGSITVESPSLYSGLNMANNSLGKQINLSHAVVLVFSEELAKEGGVGKYLRGAVRGREFRPNMFVAVSRSSAEEYLKSIKPVQEIDPSKFYQLKFSSYKYTGFSDGTTFFDFYTEMESYAVQPVAALVDVSRYKSEDEFDIRNSTYKEKGKPVPFEGDYKAGDIPKTGDIAGEIMGLAAFSGLIMVGELDGEEAADYLMVTSSYNNSYITFTDPKDKDKVIILNVKQSRKPVRKVEIANGKLQIKVQIKLEADILAIQSGINYEAPENTKLLEDNASERIRNNIERFLNKTAKEFKSDICGFGRSVKGKFLTWKEWENYNWLDKYKDSSFDVSVDLKIRRPGLMVRSLPAVSSQGGDIPQ